MKRHGSLWEKITSFENIELAHIQARKNKGHYRDVKKVNACQEIMLNELRRNLLDKTFTTAKYKIIERIEGGKLRSIYKLPYYPDRIVQHCLLSVVGPIMIRSLIRDTFQSIPGRGTSDVRRRIQKAMQGSDPPKYSLQLDIKKYYPSINNDKLKRIIRRKIKCPDTLWLLDDIIDSHIGLPIGNYTSQILGNFYLYQVDWHMKQIGVKHYYRYCDDIVMMGDSKEQLLLWFEILGNKLQELDLVIKPDYKVIDMEEDGLDFVGYVFYSEKTKLRKRIVKGLALSASKLTKKYGNKEKALRSTMSYKGWVKYINAKMLWRSQVTNKAVTMCGGIFKQNPLRRPI